MRAGLAVVMRWALAGYATAGVLALLLVPASDGGWLGPEADAAAAVLALTLALPWSPLLLLMPGNSAWVGGVALGIALVVNLWAGRMLLRWVEDD